MRLRALCSPPYICFLCEVSAKQTVVLRPRGTNRRNGVGTGLDNRTELRTDHPPRCTRRSQGMPRMNNVRALKLQMQILAGKDTCHPRAGMDTCEVSLPFFLHMIYQEYWRASRSILAPCPDMSTATGRLSRDSILHPTCQQKKRDCASRKQLFDTRCSG